MSDVTNYPDYSVPFWLHRGKGNTRVELLVKTENGWINVGKFTDSDAARLFFAVMRRAIRVQMSGTDVHCKMTGMEVQSE